MRIADEKNLSGLKTVEEVKNYWVSILNNKKLKPFEIEIFKERAMSRLVGMGYSNSFAKKELRKCYE